MSKMQQIVIDMDASELNELIELASAKRTRILEQPRIDATRDCKEQIENVGKNYDMGLIDHNEYLLQIFDCIKAARKV